MKILSQDMTQRNYLMKIMTETKEGEVSTTSPFKPHLHIVFGSSTTPTTDVKFRSFKKKMLVTIMKHVVSEHANKK